jgi:hypothetical protein
MFARMSIMAAVMRRIESIVNGEDMGVSSLTICYDLKMGVRKHDDQSEA